MPNIGAFKTHMKLKELCWIWQVKNILITYTKIVNHHTVWEDAGFSACTCQIRLVAGSEDALRKWSWLHSKFKLVCELWSHSTYLSQESPWSHYPTVSTKNIQLWRRENKASRYEMASEQHASHLRSAYTLNWMKFFPGSSKYVFFFSWFLGQRKLIRKKEESKNWLDPSMGVPRSFRHMRTLCLF